jgi:hypothetical protein
MADALKAEGNKLFAAKDFTGSMFVLFQPYGSPIMHVRSIANMIAVRSSRKPSKLTPQIMSSTPIDQAHMLR